MRLRCCNFDEDQQKFGFLYCDRNFTRAIWLTKMEIEGLKYAETRAEMTKLPDHIDCGFYEPVVAFAIYTLLMTKPGDQELVGSVIETKVDL